MYPSDLKDAQWSKLQPLLNPPRGSRHAGGRPRKYELRRVVDALLYACEDVGRLLKPGLAELGFEERRFHLRRGRVPE